MKNIRFIILLHEFWCTVFLISLLVIIDVEARTKERVCIIGAGRAGLAAIKKVAEQLDKFEPIAFERNSDVGGLWIYRDTEVDEHNLPAHSGIYKNLRTITHKDVMVYPDYPSLETTGTSPFVSHETFLEYMRNYTDNFKLRQYIQLDSLVTKVTVVESKCNRRKIRWHLTYYNLNTGDGNTVVCDAVIVCNGRYSKPNIPIIPGIEKFSGRVLHSRTYRNPEDFAKKTVLVLGGGFSGTGITRDLSNHAKTVYFSHKRCKDFVRDDLPSNVKQVCGVVGAQKKKLILENKSTIVADTLILCTGYLYDFQFLDDSSGIDLEDRHQLSPMRDYFINDVHPSMAFIGLREDDGLTHMYYSQLDHFLSTLNGSTIMPGILSNNL